MHEWPDLGEIGIVAELPGALYQFFSAGREGQFSWLVTVGIMMMAVAVIYGKSARQAVRDHVTQCQNEIGAENAALEVHAE